MKIVRVKVVQSGTVKTMTEEVANRLVSANPKDYVILESPKVEVINLPPVEKKSAEVVGGSLNAGTSVPSNEKVAEQATNAPTTQVAMQEFEKRKPGRPKVNA